MPRKQKSKLKITHEILPLGTLKRDSLNSDRLDPAQRWIEIQDICADIIRRNSQTK